LAGGTAANIFSNGYTPTGFVVRKI